jgi:translation initiation factor 3 subunit H
MVRTACSERLTSHVNGPVDISQTVRGNASFRAFRLSKAFLDAHKRNRFNTQSCVLLSDICLRANTKHSLISHRLTFSSILEEIPLKIRTNPLLNAYVHTLTEPQPSPLADVHPASASSSALPPAFSTLDLGNPTLTKNLESLIESLDNYKTEEGNLAYLSRQIGREKARAETYVAKRKEENAMRVAQGLAPLPEEDVSRLFKIPPEPSRLDSMLLLGQIDAYAKTLEGSSSASLVKMYAAKASSDS